MDMELSDTESALILNSDGGIRFVVTAVAGDDIADDAMLLITLLGILLKEKDKHFEKLIQYKMEEYIYSKVTDSGRQNDKGGKP